MAIPSKSSLLSLKTPQLKFLLKTLGLEVGGTKEQMVSRITSPKAAPLDSPRRVVSIDMGIRNLAFCFIELPSPRKKLARPKVLAWERICIPPTEAGRTPPGMEIWNDTKVPADEEEDEVNAAEVEEEERKQKKKKKEAVKPKAGRTKMSQLMEELKGLVPGLNPGAQTRTENNSPPAGASVGMGQVATPSDWGQTLSERLKSLGKSGSMESAQEELESSRRLRKNSTTIEEQSDLESTSTTKRSSSMKRRKPQDLDELRQILAESLAERDANPPLKPIKESFEPAIFAVHANNFCRSLLQRFPPLDAILIEQQRIKSGAGIAVVEWIVHVNRFEAMIHATLRCLRDEERITASVESVSPARVMDYWIDESVKVMSRVRRRTPDGDMAYHERNISGAGKTKMQKIALVSEWVEKGVTFDVAEGLEDIADHFVRPQAGERKKVVKLDDLADCLLQGLAWAEWQENRRKFADGTLLDELEMCTEK